MSGVAAEPMPYEAEVRDYLDSCRQAGRELKLKRSFLDPKAHPTEAGACKLIWHNGDAAEAAKIRAAFQAVTQNKQRGEAA